MKTREANLGYLQAEGCSRRRLIGERTTAPLILKTMSLDEIVFLALKVSSAALKQSQ